MNASKIQPIEFRGRRPATTRPTAANGSVMIATPFSPVPGGILVESTTLQAASRTNRPTMDAVTGEIRRSRIRFTI